MHPDMETQNLLLCLPYSLTMGYMALGSLYDIIRDNLYGILILPLWNKPANL